jgi:hypothetical protein
MFTAVPHTTLPAQNHATATNSIGLRPQMSDSLAQMGPAAALASRYAPPIHTKPDELCSDAEMVGMAVAMMVWSSAAMKSESWRDRAVSFGLRL